MIINISFAELRDYIKTHYDKSLTFSRVSEKELCASYEQHILFKTVQVPVSISIENVTPTSITISYNGRFGIDMIIAGAMAFLKAKMPELSDTLVPEEGHCVRIELSKLNQTKALIEALVLKEIHFLDNAVQVTASLK